MLRSTARRLTAITFLAAVLVAALVTISSATATANATAHRPQVVYRNFCPASPNEISAAGPYVLWR